MKKIAIIPARAGSKGIKDKNIINLCGKPLMAYSIEAAIQSRLFEHVIVTTDSHKYIHIAEQYGAMGMLRGEALSNDTATTFMVIEDLLNRINEKYDYFVLLQPTSPMRNAIHIREACELFEKAGDKFDFLVSVKEAEHASVLVKPIEADLSLKHFDTDFSQYRRQTYKDYSPNGAIFIARPEAYLQRKHFFGDKSIAYRMSAEDSIDIDTEFDYEIASFLMERRGK